jgi:hypothetical protein
LAILDVGKGDETVRLLNEQTDETLAKLALYVTPRRPLRSGMPLIG